MVAMGHGIYVFTIQGFRFTKVFISYLIGSLAGLFLFLPWIIVIIFDSKGEVDQYVSWTQKSVPLASLLQSWLLNTSRIFWDFNDSFSYSKLWIYLIIIIFVSYSVYYLYHYTNKQVWLLIFTMMGMPILFLFLPDLILGGQRSTSIRYLTPLFLGIQIAVAYLLANKLTNLPVKAWKQKLWQIIMLALISSGVISCVMFTQADTWWSKYLEYYHTEVAKIINQTERPLVLAPWYEIRTLSYSLNSDVFLCDISLQKKFNIKDEEFDNVFIYKRKNFLEYFIEQNPNYSLKNTFNWKKRTTPVNTTATTLWQLSKKSGRDLK